MEARSRNVGGRRRLPHSALLDNSSPTHPLSSPLLRSIRLRSPQLPPPAAMDRRFFLFCFLVLPLLFSGGQAALTFQDIWNLALPQSTSPAKTAVDNPSHHRGDVTPSVAGEDGGTGEVADHSKTSVDFGTRGWPYVYYTRRDTKGTVDWGNLAWPYIYYSKREGGRDDVSAGATVDRGAVRYGRKGGDRLKL